MTWTIVGSNGVPTDMLTAPIVGGTLILKEKTKVCYGYVLRFLTLSVKNIAANPFFWTELSDKNSSLKLLPSDVITCFKSHMSFLWCFFTHWRKLIATIKSMVSSLFRSHFWGYSKTVILTVLIVPLNIKVGEVDCNSPLWGCYDFPNAMFVAVKKTYLRIFQILCQ